MFFPCSERPSLTIPAPSSYTALSPLYVTSHDWDIHSTCMRRVCTTHPLYEGLVFVLPLAVLIAPELWHVETHHKHVFSNQASELLLCRLFVKCWDSNSDLMNEDLCMSTSSEGDSDGHQCLRRPFLE